jgi:hypothetical protein
MMKDQPSQQMPEETLVQRVLIGIMMIAILLFASWVPDFTLSEEDCMKQESSAHVKNLCSDSKAK